MAASCEKHLLRRSRATTSRQLLAKRLDEYCLNLHGSSIIALAKIPFFFVLLVRRRHDVSTSQSVSQSTDIRYLSRRNTYKSNVHPGIDHPTRSASAKTTVVDTFGMRFPTKREHIFHTQDRKQIPSSWLLNSINSRNTQSWCVTPAM